MKKIFTVLGLMALLAISIFLVFQNKKEPVYIIDTWQIYYDYRLEPNEMQMVINQICVPGDALFIKVDPEHEDLFYHTYEEIEEREFQRLIKETQDLVNGVREAVRIDKMLNTTR